MYVDNMTVLLTEAQLKRVIEETQLSELVYVDRLNKGKAMLSYDNSGSKKHVGNKSQDKIKTDKMDRLDGDTYEVPLKGGIVSYNITSINGDKVMHYFKRYWDAQKTSIRIGKDDYELEMLDSEFKRFMDTFKKKVWKVIECYINKSRVDVDAVSILPVQSSSNFNRKMAGILSETGLNGVECRVIDESLFRKDLRNIQKDKEFIEKNKDFYGANLFNRQDNPTLAGSAEHLVDREVAKQRKIKQLNDLTREINRNVKYVQDLINIQYPKAIERGAKIEGIVDRMAQGYMRYYDLYMGISGNLKYGDGEGWAIRSDKGPKPMKYAKPASTGKRMEKIWPLIKDKVQDKVCPITGKKYKCINMQPLEITSFQMKNLPDATRMGIKGVFSPNQDMEVVERELEKINGTLFVVFDDNISGGATLSDICWQAKELGIEHICPITFGKMRKKTTYGGMPMNVPVDKNGVVGNYNL